MGGWCGQTGNDPHYHDHFANSPITAARHPVWTASGPPSPHHHHYTIATLSQLGRNPATTGLPPRHTRGAMLWTGPPHSGRHHQVACPSPLGCQHWVTTTGPPKLSPSRHHRTTIGPPPGHKHATTVPPQPGSHQATTIRPSHYQAVTLPSHHTITPLGLHHTTTGPPHCHHWAAKTGPPPHHHRAVTT